MTPFGLQTADIIFILFFFLFILAPLLLAWRLVNRDSDERRGRGNAVSFTSGAGAIERAGVIPGVMRTIEEVLDDLVGSSNVELIDIIKLRPRGSGKGGGGDNSGEGRGRRHWGQLASL